MSDLTGTYVARANFFANGKHHAPGSELYLSHDEAKRAIEQGTVVVEQPKAPPHPAEARNAELEAENASIAALLADAAKRIEELEGLLAQVQAPTQTDSTESTQGGEKPPGPAQAQAKGDKRK